MSYLKYKNYDIYYTKDGSNDEVIVLLNGIMMSTASWEMFKDNFSEHNTLVRYDMIDQGQSSKAMTQYTQEQQVEVLFQLLNTLKYKKVSLVGISYGASVALQFAVKYPELVNKLVIANGVAKTSSWLKAIGDGWNEVAKSRNGLAYYNISIPYIYSPTFYEENIEWMEDRKKILVPLFSDELFLDSMNRLTISAETHDVQEKLKDIKSKTLIISSSLDFLTPVFEQEYLHKHIKDSELVILPNCGHASMYEAPKQFTELVLNFVNK